MSGSVLASEYIRLAAYRHLNDRYNNWTDNDSTAPYRFDIESAQIVLDFFTLLKHSKGEWAGTVFAPAPWQQFIVWVLFGWLSRTDSTRRFRTAYIEVPRKNGKSTLLAAIGLYMLVMDGEPGAEVYAAATKKDQAKIVYEEAVRMRTSSPSISSRVQKFQASLIYKDCKFVPLSSDEDTLDGLNVHAALVDELHEHKNSALYDVLDSATGSRRQPLMFSITTAGFDRLSVCWSQHEYSHKILTHNFADETFFAFVACLDADDEKNWDDETVWAKANPNLNVSAKIDDLRRKAARAKEQPSYLNNFLRKHLNVWTQQDKRWMPMDKWSLCVGALIGKTDVEKRAELTLRLRGHKAYGGLDLASTTDIAALVLLFPPFEEIKAWTILPYFWIPEEGMRVRSKRDRVKYDLWTKQGFISATAGDVIDYDFIRADINKCAEAFDIQEIAFDRWNSTQLVTQLGNDGLTMVKFGQGFESMAAPTKQIMKLVLGKELAHADNPVMNWMADNITVRTDPAGNEKIDKEKSREKVDGMVALAMALGRALVDPDLGDSVYNSRGVLTF